MSRLRSQKHFALTHALVAYLNFPLFLATAWLVIGVPSSWSLVVQLPISAALLLLSPIGLVPLVLGALFGLGVWRAFQRFQGLTLAHSLAGLGVAMAGVSMVLAFLAPPKPW